MMKLISIVLTLMISNSAWAVECNLPKQSIKSRMADMMSGKRSDGIPKSVVKRLEAPTVDPNQQAFRQAYLKGRLDKRDNGFVAVKTADGDEKLGRWVRTEKNGDIVVELVNPTNARRAGERITVPTGQLENVRFSREAMVTNEYADFIYSSSHMDIDPRTRFVSVPNGPGGERSAGYITEMTQINGEKVAYVTVPKRGKDEVQVFRGDEISELKVSAQSRELLGGADSLTYPRQFSRVSGGNEGRIKAHTSVGRIYATTDAGPNSKYPQNEDSVAVVRNGDRTTVIVGDGMGGQGDGAAASNVVTEFLADQISEGASATQAIKRAPARLKQARELDNVGNENMGMTLAIVEMQKSGPNDVILRATHVGDTKVVVLRGKKIQLETLDHNPIYDQYRFGDKPVEIPRGYGSTGTVTRGVMGTGEAVEPGGVILNGVFDPKGDPTPILRAKNGDRVVMASDGLWDIIEPDEVADLIEGLSAKEATTELRREVARREANHAKAKQAAADQAKVEGQPPPRPYRGWDNTTLAVIDVFAD